MLKALVFALLTLCCPWSALAQNDVWVFGSWAGLRFEDDTVVPFISPLFAENGVATISDPITKKLLIHTDGFTAFNADLDTMLNGTGLRSGGWYGQSAQSALIVPSPVSPSRYYIFTMGVLPPASYEKMGLHYSVVDMTLDGGKGGIVVKNVPLLKETAYALSAIRHANKRDAWVLCQSLTGDSIYSFLISRSGVSKSPVVSHGGYERQKCYGSLRPSQDGSQFLLTSGDTREHKDNIIQLYSFNSSNGSAKFDTIIFDPGIEYWGSIYDAAFSVDGRIVYFTMAYSLPSERSSLWQFPLTYRDSAKKPIMLRLIQPRTSEFSYSALHLGPDGSLYIPMYDAYFASRIAHPNLIYPACELVDTAIPFFPDQKGIDTRYGLQNILLQPLDYSVTPPGFEIEPLSCGSNCYRFVSANVSSGSDVNWIVSGDTSMSMSGAEALFCAEKGRYVVTMIAGADTSAHAFWPMGMAPGIAIPVGVSRNISKDSSILQPVRLTITAPPELSELHVKSMALHLRYPSDLLTVSSAGRRDLDTNGWGADEQFSYRRTVLAIADTSPRPFPSTFDFGTLEISIKDPNFQTADIDLEWIEIYTDSGVYYLCPPEERTITTLHNTSLKVKPESPVLSETCTGPVEIHDLLGRTVASVARAELVQSAMDHLPPALYFVGCREFGFRKFMNR